MKLAKRKRKVLGYAWVKNFRRPVYGLREIRRGKCKGWIEVIYRAGYELFRKIKIQPQDFQGV